METVLVVGAGFMGAGIAQVCAQSGRRVLLQDVQPKALETAMAGIRSSLEKLEAKGRLAEPAPAVLERINLERDLSGAAQADWVIEAAVELEPVKLDLFRELDRLARPETPLASNTSSIPISRLARAASRPERVLGLHFFGPVPLMHCVEVVQAADTSPEVFQRGLEFVRSLGKRALGVRRDIPGFVLNRVFAAAMREAMELVAEGVVSPEDLDAGMRLGYGWTAGPFQIADNAGLDTFAHVSRYFATVGEANLAARTDLLERLISDGRLGRKAGRGFYAYPPDGEPVALPLDD